ncbi:MAG: efflux RND transporter periplasmic adaptor subunit [Variovorax sp.]|uniref:Multidrug resistance protein MdtA-like C-terminal permuted SH3 domain-containing protein n=1 Tax=Variovorax paradoxus TaxID=34073 RepID=A0A2W5SBQ6_VARPD|nr:efflux RND transporter periplasmic adaptor subunit [Variovorax sp.]PZQ77063.1 MAG: hypothetical protein DI563_05060 [Variovorax paradoxus]
MTARTTFLRRPLTMLAASIALTAHGAPGAHGPNGEHLDAPATTNTSGLARLPDGSVQVPMLAQRRMGVRTVIAAESDAAATIELSGRVSMDPNAGGLVQSALGGRVEAGPAGLPVAGQAVRKGEVLGYVRYAADPFAQANQRAQLAEARSNHAAAQQRVARLESLEGTVPRKEIEAARAELQGLNARMTQTAGSLGAREALTAPVAGTIARADARAGQIVEPRAVLFEVVDTTRLLVEATVADPGIGGRIGKATLRSPSGASLVLVGAAASLRDGSLPLTFRATATDGKPLPLAVGQPVTVIATLNETVKGYVLPTRAVVRNPANEPVVWIKSGAQRFIPQPVQYRALDASRVVVTQGLGADNRVVVEGASLIAQIR